MIDLGATGITTVLWATGYRRAYPWLHVPVLDPQGELVHEGGITPVPGLYALGLYFMRRRNSSLLDGVGLDTVELADHILGRMTPRRDRGLRGQGWRARWGTRTASSGVTTWWSSGPEWPARPRPSCSPARASGCWQSRGWHGSDTLSTHALTRAGVLQLRWWGLLDRLAAAGTPPIHQTTFHYGPEAIGVPIEARDGVDALHAPRRTVLDAMLVDAAREAGARVVHGARIDELLRDGRGRVRGVQLTDAAGVPRRVEAGLVVGADGVRSGVAGAAGAEVLHEGRHAAAIVYGVLGRPARGRHPLVLRVPRGGARDPDERRHGVRVRRVAIRALRRRGGPGNRVPLPAPAPRGGPGPRRGGHP